MKKSIVAVMLLIGSMVGGQAQAGILMLMGHYGKVDGKAIASGVVLIVLGGIAGLVIDENTVASDSTKALVGAFPELANDLTTTQAFASDVIAPAYAEAKKDENGKALIVIDSETTKAYFANSAVPSATVSKLAAALAK